MGGSATVAVRTDHLALLNLREDRRSGLIRQLAADGERLFPQMVELKNDRICLAAVGARVETEILQEQLGGLELELDLSLVRTRDVAATVGDVVLAAVLRWQARQ
jgi:hypothetical protein